MSDQLHFPGATVYCIYEDRPSCEVGVRLAIASLQRHCPGASVVFFSPAPSAGLQTWIAARPGVRWQPRSTSGHQGWNVKGDCLVQLLDAGAREAIWLDSDLIVVRDFRPRLAAAGESLVVAQEPPHLCSGDARAGTVAWGLAPGRDLGFTLNACFLRVTPRHRDLLLSWSEILNSPTYQQAQARPYLERPAYFNSDQEALGALLGSAEFASLEVAALAAGSDVVHSGGLRIDRLGDRLARLFGPAPLFIHAMAVKPWDALGAAGANANLSWWLLRLAQEVAEYPAHARKFRCEIDLPCPWLDYGTWTGRTLRVLGFGRDALRGLPLAIVAALASSLRWRHGRLAHR